MKSTSKEELVLVKKSDLEKFRDIWYLVSVFAQILNDQNQTGEKICAYECGLLFGCAWHVVELGGVSPLSARQGERLARGQGCRS